MYYCGGDTSILVSGYVRQVSVETFIEWFQDYHIVQNEMKFEWNTHSQCYWRTMLPSVYVHVYKYICKNKNGGRMLRQRPCRLQLLCVQAHCPTTHMTKSWAGLLARRRDHGTLGQSGVFDGHDSWDVARGQTARCRLAETVKRPNDVTVGLETSRVGRPGGTLHARGDALPAKQQDQLDLVKKKKINRNIGSPCKFNLFNCLVLLCFSFKWMKTI
jgi:hypothetical protein